MPRPRIRLPSELAGRPFALGEALELGVPRGRLSDSDLTTPFKGVRANAAAPLAPLSLVEAFALRRPLDHIISHTTALLRWGAPLPRRVEQEPTIHVSSLDGVTPRAVRTTGHTLDPTRTGVSVLDSIELTDPATSWVLSAPLLSLDDLVAAGDYLITGTEPFDGVPPLTSLDALLATVEAHAGMRGIRRAREGIALVRYGSLSRQETFSRLMVVRAGLPEPQLNYRVHHPDNRGHLIAMVDLAFVEFRSAIDFESLLHMSPVKFRRDIRKQQELAAIDWTMHRLTSDDVDPRLHTHASRAATARIARALHDRGWRPAKPRN